jgi:hypothetical protein
MTLPRLTHLQFLVLSALLRAPRAGRSLREALSASGIRQSGPAFYQMMAGLEDAAFVSGWYEQKIVDGQIIRERHYKVLVGGRKAWIRSRDFYVTAIKGVGDLAREG